MPEFYMIIAEKYFAELCVARAPNPPASRLLRL